MVSSCKYFAAFLTLLIFNSAISLPIKRSECIISPDLYPPNFRLNDTLHYCENTKLLEDPILSFCDEIIHVQNETSSCGLGGLLQHVSNDTYMNIISKSLAVPMIDKIPICEIFKNLNSSLYHVYLDKPGFGKQLVRGLFCPMFCGKDDNYCEVLLRTYWIKKVLLGVLQDKIKEEENAKDKADLKHHDHSITPNKDAENILKKTGSGPSANITAKLTDADKVNKSKSGMGSVNVPISSAKEKFAKINKTTMALPELDIEMKSNQNNNKTSPMSAKKQIIKPNEKKSDDNNKLGKYQDLAADTDLKMKSDDTNQAVAANKIENRPIPEIKKDKLNHANKMKENKSDLEIKENKMNDASDIKENQPDLEIKENKVNDANKIKETQPDLEIKENKANDGNKMKENQPEKEIKENKANDGSKMKENQPEKDLKIKENKANDGSEIKETHSDLFQTKENDKTEESNNMNEQIPVIPDKVINDDIVTAIEKDTEFGNQIRDFSDGYAEQGNEYQDGPQEEPEAPVTIETIQTDLKDDNIDKNLQPDGTNLDKQLNKVPQLSAFPEEEDSHFFAYFLTIVVLCIAGYLIFHNKQKIIALIIEGRHERRRRPNNGTYKRLDSKDGAKATSHVIF